MGSLSNLRTKRQIGVAADNINRWRDRPDLMVRELFPGTVPDAWQEEVLRAFPNSRRQAMVACKGPGKTTVECWLIINFMLTRRHPKIPVTSVTGDQLRDVLWAELAKWHQRSALLQALFTWQKTRYFANDFPDTWFATARTWSRDADPSQQADTLAGFHADYLLFVLDESGAIPRSVMAAAEAAMASGIETHILQGGNPTQLDGALYDAATQARALWEVYHITGDPDDPKRTPRMPVEWAREMIAVYGRDHPWVLVNVFGRFPPHSWNALIGPSEMAAAAKRAYHEHDIAYSPRVLGVDVAREGDDASVMFPRQGLVLSAPSMWRNVDGIIGAGQVARKIQDWDVDATFVDNTGGYGASWIDNLRLLGYAPIAVQFSGEPNDRRYYNKRAEMYFGLVEWIKQGGQVPECPELVKALTHLTYTFKGDRFLIEEKKQFKIRADAECDHADAAALTFAQSIGSRAGRERERLPGRRSRFKSEYNPYEIRHDEILH